MEPTADLKTLIEKWISGEISPGEKTQFYALIEDKRYEVEFRSIMSARYENQAPTEDNDVAWELMVQSILRHKAPVRKISFFKWVAAAAIVTGIFITSKYFLFKNPQKNPSSISQIKQLEINPASNRALLILSTGQKIILDSARTGLLAKLGNTSVTKTDSGKLLYSSSNNPSSASKNNNSSVTAAETSFNELSTPRGGIYELQLPDGTKAWLNAASRISYPTRFTGKNREVFIEGEIYFEVAHDAAHPFIVSLPAKTKEQGKRGHWLQVEVLGTHFNVNAYADNKNSDPNSAPDFNPVRTTLLEGSIKISAHGNIKTIKPGEQAIAKYDSKGIEVNKSVDLDKVMAWRNGKISITDVSVQQLMSEISRWYDMDVEYKGPIPNKDFYGSIRRDVPLSTVLNALKSYGVNTEVVGKKIIVQ